MGTPQPNLPPGFRFHPTDEELILHYLKKKVASLPLPVSIIAEVDIYKLDPWDLPGKAVFGEKEWYFFSPRGRKYPNGVRPNRAAGSGYWKATGTDKNIVASISLPAAQGGVVQGQNIGVKKALVFHTGRAPKGVKTNWIMHEYRLVDNNNNYNKALKLKDSSMRLDYWVLCRIYKKPKCTTLSSSTTEAEAEVGDQQDQKAEVQKLFIKDNTFLPFSNSTPPSPQKNTLKSQKSLSFTHLLLDANDYSMLSSFLSENHSNSNFNSNPLTGINGPCCTAAGSSYDQNLVQESSSQANTTIISNSYLFQKNLVDPQLNLNPSVPSSNMESMMIIRPNNINKRQFSDMDDENMLQYPSKKYLSSSSSCNLPNTNPQYENPQWNLNMKQSLFNQHLLLGPHLQFQG